MTTEAATRELSTALKGRTFGPPLFDYLLIGGGLSLVVTAVVLLNPLGPAFVSVAALPYLFLLSNAAHFAASTVRLYTKPGCYEALPFLTMAFPLVSLVVLTVCILFYGACLLLGYVLFHGLPLAYVFAGFGKVESVLLVVAAINLHHFIVDGYIWRLKKSDSNYRVVESGAVA